MELPHLDLSIIPPTYLPRLIDVKPQLNLGLHPDSLPLLRTAGPDLAPPPLGLGLPRQGKCMQ